MHQPATIVLIGLRGSGKTTVGPIVARILKRPFADLDDAVRDRYNGRSIAEVWNAIGEGAFRRAELESLPPLLRSPGVLALGGGTPTIEDARLILADAQARGSARIIYLRAAPATLRARLAGEDMSNRPSLTGADPLDEIESVFTARDPAFGLLAGLVIDTDDLTPEEIAGRILKSL